MDLTKLTKQELTTALTNQTAATQQMTNVANYLYTHVNDIDNKLITLNLPSKRLGIFWIWNNRQALLEVILFVISRIKEVKAKIKELNDNANKPANVPAE